jgi:electron transport complex protein RnfC
VDTLLCGALDSDPSACLNSALAARYPIELAAGMTVIGRLTRARRAAVIVDAHIPASWFPGIRKFCAISAIAVEPIINDYPQADPTLMVYALLGRRLRPGRLPTDQGVVLIDAAAAVAVGRYALLEERMLHTPLVVRDHVANQSFYLTVPVGALLSEVFQRIALGTQGRLTHVGDLLRNVRVSSDSIIGGGELMFHSTYLPAPVNPSPCIRCGWCVDSCPTRVQPAIALEASQREDVDLAEHAGIEACIECGICSYVCPSQLPLLEGIRRMKVTLKDAHGDSAQPA